MSLITAGIATYEFHSFDVQAKTDSQKCLNELRDFLVSGAPGQAPEVYTYELSHGGTAQVLFHNQTIANAAKAGSVLERMPRVHELIKTNGGFDIKVQENGLVVAAAIDPRRGGYARAAWTRDIARVFEGVVALGRREDARRIALAVANMNSTSAQLERYFANIRNPALHFQGPHSAMNVPRIRIDSANFGNIYNEEKKPKSGELLWNHKQNDALALGGIVLLRALELELISIEDLSLDQTAFLLSLVSYFKRVYFWRMHDAGAWEEWEARRTSSIGLVTKFIEMLLENKEVLAWMRNYDTQAVLPDDIHEFVDKALHHASLTRMKQEGYRVVREQLAAGGEAPFDYAGREVTGKRLSDAALAHLLWYPLNDFSEQETRSVIEIVLKLQRPAGIPRYESDLYMFTLYYFNEKNGQAVVPPELLKTDQQISTHDLWTLYHPRQPHKASEWFGDHLEPQWGIADPILATAYLRLYRKFGKPEDFEAFERHSLRSWGMLTPMTPEGQGPLAADGRRVKAFVMPEAYIPMPVYETNEEGQKVLVTIHYVPSKNTPLNWVTSELAVLHTEAGSTLK